MTSGLHLRCDRSSGLIFEIPRRNESLARRVLAARLPHIYLSRLTAGTDAYTRLTGAGLPRPLLGCTQLARLPKSDPSTPPWSTQPDALALPIVTRYLHMAARAPDDVPSQGSFRHAALRLQKSARARATTWAISFWAIDRPSGPQLSRWSCELDSGHTLHGSIPSGCIERSRRFLRLTAPVCRAGRYENRAGFSDLFVVKLAA
jgi:hypothetical protein